MSSKLVMTLFVLHALLIMAMAQEDYIKEMSPEADTSGLLGTDENTFAPIEDPVPTFNADDFNENDYQNFVSEDAVNPQQTAGEGQSIQEALGGGIESAMDEVKKYMIAEMSRQIPQEQLEEFYAGLQEKEGISREQIEQMVRQIEEKEKEDAEKSGDSTSNENEVGDLNGKTEDQEERQELIGKDNFNPFPEIDSKEEQVTEEEPQTTIQEQIKDTQEEVEKTVEEQTEENTEEVSEKETQDLVDEDGITANNEEIQEETQASNQQQEKQELNEEAQTQQQESTDLIQSQSELIKQQEAEIQSLQQELHTLKEYITMEIDAETEEQNTEKELRDEAMKEIEDQNQKLDQREQALDSRQTQLAVKESQILEKEEKAIQQEKDLIARRKALQEQSQAESNQQGGASDEESEKIAILQAERDSIENEKVQIQDEKFALEQKVAVLESQIQKNNDDFMNEREQLEKTISDVVEEGERKMKDYQSEKNLQGENKQPLTAELSELDKKELESLLKSVEDLAAMSSETHTETQYNSLSEQILSVKASMSELQQLIEKQKKQQNSGSSSGEGQVRYENKTPSHSTDSMVTQDEEKLNLVLDWKVVYFISFLLGMFAIYWVAKGCKAIKRKVSGQGSGGRHQLGEEGSANW